MKPIFRFASFLLLFSLAWGIGTKTADAHTLYQVQKGDTLSSIATKHLTNDTTIRQDNQIKSVKAGDWVAVNSLYTVRKGETLYRIATQHHVTVEQLKKWNQLKSATIRTGQSLLLREPTHKKTDPDVFVTPTGKCIIISKDIHQTEQYVPEYVTVQKGNTLNQLARDFDTTVQQLKQWNHLHSDKIYIGQKLKVMDYRTFIEDTKAVLS